MERNNEYEIVFCTHNRGKIESANQYFEGALKFKPVSNYEITEIRGSIEEIAIAKVREAYGKTGKPTIAMDAGFEVAALRGFPGSYVNAALDTIGVLGILKLMQGVSNRSCMFTQCLAFMDGEDDPVVFHGYHRGIIAPEKRGTITKDDWSELSYIFIPEEELKNSRRRTLAELTHEERVQLSRENARHSAFKAFKDWWLVKQQ